MATKKLKAPLAPAQPGATEPLAPAQPVKRIIDRPRRDPVRTLLLRSIGGIDRRLRKLEWEMDILKKERRLVQSRLDAEDQPELPVTSD